MAYSNTETKDISCETLSPPTRSSSDSLLFLTPSDHQKSSPLSFLTNSSTHSSGATKDLSFCTVESSPLFIEDSGIETDSLHYQLQSPVYFTHSTPLAQTPCSRTPTSNGTFNTEDPLPSTKRRCLFPPTPHCSEQNQQHVKQCCRKKCLCYLPQERVSFVRHAFQLRTQSEQRQFLLDSFQLTGQSTAMTHHVAGQQVCTNAFIEILGISRRRYRRVHNQFSVGCSRSLRKPPLRTVTEKTSTATAWMGSYFERIADRMPHINQLHLPQFLTKKDVYLRMTHNLQEQGISHEEIISLPHFYAIWEKNFRNVTIPAVSSSYSIIFIC